MVSIYTASIIVIAFLNTDGEAGQVRFTKKVQIFSPIP